MDDIKVYVGLKDGGAAVPNKYKVSKLPEGVQQKISRNWQSMPQVEVDYFPAHGRDWAWGRLWHKR